MSSFVFLTESEFGVEVVVIKTDFSKGAEIYDQLFLDLAKIPIGLLGEWAFRWKHGGVAQNDISQIGSACVFIL